MKESYLQSQLLAPVHERGFGMLLDPAKLTLQRNGLMIEAHPDDSALSEGMLELLTRKGISMTTVTLTDGSARDLQRYKPDALVHKRKEESIKANKISGVTDLFHGGLRDGHLMEDLDEGLEIVKGVIAVKKPEFIIVTNTRDEHTDHASAGLIALEAAAEEIPVYEMDTVYRQSVVGSELPMTHVFQMTRSLVRQRNNAYRAHESQVTALPPRQMADVRQVINLPHQRGKEHGIARAAVLFQANAVNNNLLGELLNRQLVFANAN